MVLKSECEYQTSILAVPAAAEAITTIRINEIKQWIQMVLHITSSSCLWNWSTSAPPV
jgi:hypothetical protein